MLDGLNSHASASIGYSNKRNSLRLHQTTLKNPIHCNGIGLHSGQDITLTLKPASANSGIIFKRTDVPEEISKIDAKYNNVTDTRLCTKISNEHDISVGTIEHLMAAIYACGLDNVLIEIDGPEIPVMDGSSEPFVFLIECAGIDELASPRKIIVVKKPVTVSQNGCTVSLEPYDDFTISLEIDFANQAIGNQKKFVSVSAESFKQDISRARTFGSVQDVEQLRKMGLARGASLDNAVALDGERIINEEGLRYEDEFVRHKILDCIGDLSLAGATIMGHCQGYKAGHAINNAILHELFSDSSNWELINAAEFSPAPAMLRAVGD